jgi:hypothetical protein
MSHEDPIHAITRNAQILFGNFHAIGNQINSTSRVSVTLLNRNDIVEFFRLSQRCCSTLKSYWTFGCVFVEIIPDVSTDRSTTLS